MSRHVQSAHEGPASPVLSTTSPEGESAGRDDAKRSIPFVVKLRDCGTRMWGNQIEVLAASARDAAELVSGERLRGGSGDRANLRARVWTLPFGSAPDVHFFADLATASD